MNLQPLVSILVVSHNSEKDLEACLQSVYSQDYRNFEILVVDNNSDDGSVKLVRTKYPEVNVTALEENIGFGGACNLGVTLAQGDLIAFLNPDTRVHKRWLKEIVRNILASPMLGACGSQVLFWDGERIQSLGGVYSRETGYALDLGFGARSSRIDSRSSRPVFHVCGASIVVRKSIFKLVQGFDEDYFMYFDDVDLSWRIRMRGFQVDIVPTSIVYHKIDPRRAYLATYRFWIERNSLRALLKNYELRNVIIYLPTVLALRGTALVFLLMTAKLHHAYVMIKALADVILNFRNIWKKRQEVQQKRMLKDKDLFADSLTITLEALMARFFRNVIPYL